MLGREGLSGLVETMQSENCFALTLSLSPGERAGEGECFFPLNASGLVVGSQPKAAFPFDTISVAVAEQRRGEVHGVSGFEAAFAE